MVAVLVLAIAPCLSMDAPVMHLIRGCQTLRDKSRACATPPQPVVGEAQPCTCVQGSKKQLDPDCAVANGKDARVKLRSARS